MAAKVAVAADPFKFPVLYDATEYRIDGSDRIMIRHAKGMFSYDTNRFQVPTKKSSIIQMHFPNDWDIITSVGFDLV